MRKKDAFNKWSYTSDVFKRLNLMRLEHGALIGEEPVIVLQFLRCVFKILYDMNKTQTHYR
jgi:hypothetical protein